MSIALVNQLHAVLRDLVPGGADTDLTAASMTSFLRRPPRESSRTRAVAVAARHRSARCGEATPSSAAKASQQIDSMICPLPMGAGAPHARVSVHGQLKQ
jgi:hypothetical protein